MKSISTFIAEEAIVIRNGERQTIPATDIVVGDVVQLTVVRYNHIIRWLSCTLIPKGNRTPADMRIVEASSDLHFNRSLLTGERFVIMLVFCLRRSHPLK